MADPSPLQRYLGVQQLADREMAAVLRDAAEEGERLMVKLAEKHGIGAEVRRSQIALITRELRQQQGDMWGYVTRSLEKNLQRAGQAAADAEQQLNDTLFNALGTGPIPELQASYRMQAKATVDAFKARAANGIPLSSQVYKTSALANGYVDRTVNRGILLGKSAREIAKDVRGLIRPDVPGGVSYAAMRLGRTELNNAFHRAQTDLRRNDPFVSAMKWNLSGSHPRTDECDAMAGRVTFAGGGPGEYKPTEVPPKPHPQCFCYLTAVPISNEQFISEFMAGKYNRYIDEKVYTHLPKSVLPC